MKIPRLKENQIFYMLFSSGYREYFSVGKDLELMAENILKRYNSYCVQHDKIESIEKMVKIAEKEDYSFNTYVINLNSASDMDYTNFDNELFLGDYLSHVRAISS